MRPYIVQLAAERAALQNTHLQPELFHLCDHQVDPPSACRETIRRHGEVQLPAADRAPKWRKNLARGAGWVVTARPWIRAAIASSLSKHMPALD